MDVAGIDWKPALHRGGVLLLAALLAGCGATGADDATDTGQGTASGEMAELDGIPVAPGKLSPEQQAALFAPSAPGATP